MIRIITDSAADFEPWELERMEISCIALNVTFGQREYRENVDLAKDQFYHLLAQAEDLPKTSQASPQILMDLFEQALAAGDEAIYICLSSALSGTYQSAVMVRQMMDSAHCYVVDSLNGTGGQRMLVEYAVRLRDEGKTAAQIVAGVEALRSRITLFACMDTMGNLYRGGRISQTTYKLGTLANIKPIINVDQAGRVQVPAKAMGIRKGMEWLCKRVTQQEPDAKFPFYVMYTDNRENGMQLARMLRDMGHRIPDENVIQVGAAIGTHIGPNAVGFVYVSGEEV